MRAQWGLLLFPTATSATSAHLLTVPENRYIHPPLYSLLPLPTHAYPDNHHPIRRCDRKRSEEDVRNFPTHSSCVGWQLHRVDSSCSGIFLFGFCWIASSRPRAHGQQPSHSPQVCSRPWGKERRTEANALHTDSISLSGSQRTSWMTTWSPRALARNSQNSFR